MLISVSDAIPLTICASNVSEYCSGSVAIAPPSFWAPQLPHLPDSFHRDPQLLCDIISIIGGTKSNMQVSYDFLEGTLVCKLGQKPKLDPVK